MTASILSNGRHSGAFGMAGGSAGMPGINRVERADGTVELLDHIAFRRHAPRRRLRHRNPRRRRLRDPTLDRVAGGGVGGADDVQLGSSPVQRSRMPRCCASPIGDERAAGVEPATGRGCASGRASRPRGSAARSGGSRARPRAAPWCTGAAGARGSARSAELDDATEVHHRDAVGDVPRQAEVVRDDEDRDTGLVDQTAHAASGSRRAPTRRGSTPARRRRATAGSSTIAPAITTRCRCPPETSCGYSPTNRSGGRSPDRDERARDERFLVAPRLCARAVPRRRPRRSSAAGSSAPVGSWNTICTRLRYPRRRHRAEPRIGSPSNRTSPCTGRSRPMIVRASVVLPQPDSPTSASTSPSRTSRSTPSTARAGACRRRRRPLAPKCTWRSRTSSRGARRRLRRRFGPDAGHSTPLHLARADLHARGAATGSGG